MILFQGVFLLLALIAGICAVTAIHCERRNWGYIGLCFLALSCDVNCYFLIGSRGLAEAKAALTVYYVMHGWFCIMNIIMILHAGKHRRLWMTLVPAGIVGALQSGIILANLAGYRVLSFGKHVFLGQNWWIAKPAQEEALVLNLMTYYRSFAVSILLILFAAVMCLLTSPRIYHGKYYIYIGMQLLIAFVEFGGGIMQYPVWINAILQTVTCITYLYFVRSYNRAQLRKWSLQVFGNEMSDGFILYDEHDRVAYLNRMLAGKLPPERIEAFQNRENLEHWMQESITVEGMEVLPCETDSGLLYFKVRKSELTQRDRNMGTIYILHDTTQSVDLIQAMRTANEELERATRMKSDFLANMSHEIRTPMNAVIGMAELALREEIPEKATEYLTQIRSSGRNLLNIINDILDYSKIEAGKMEILPGRYEPLSELEDIANVLSTRIEGKDLELFVICDTAVPRALEGDAMRIRQILLNLANNAVKFTSSGIVGIRVQCEKQPDDRVLMTYHVIDTGIGIKEEDLEKIFVSFQQVDSKRNRSVEGTGLGLAISRKLCEAMGGSMGVSSEYGKGSDFWFTIPQRVLDPALDLTVREPETRFAYCINENVQMTDEFVKEVTRLGVGAKVIPSPEAYEPTGKKDYVFFDEKGYTDEIRAFLKAHPDVNGVVLVAFASRFVPDLPNLRVMRRPETTLAMVHVLNDADADRRHPAEEGAFAIDFTAPDARALIVDDNAINITVTKGLLEPVEITCDGALSGREAIRMIEEQDYDLVFMDHMMPEMDGVEATRYIRAHIPKAKNLPIIALSANAMEEARELFRRSGMNDFVAKPVEIRTLISCVRRWLPEEKIRKGSVSGASGAQEEISFEGLDCETAIAALGSSGLYRKIVEEYYRSGGEKLSMIRKSFREEDWDSYTIRVHALKSSSRQIGAMQLGSLAEELEKAGKSRDYDFVREKTEEMLSAFDSLLRTLSRYFPDDPGAGARPRISEERLHEILAGLEEACDDLDMDRMEEAAAWLKEYSHGERDREIRKLYQAIDHVDIEACTALIESLRK